MDTLKETYSNATALFTACPAPVTDHAADIKSLIWGRWFPYELCLEDKDDWETWFKYLIEENWDRAEKLYSSIDLVTDPTKSFSKTTTTTGTITDTDTLKIEDSEEEAHATSGYNNGNTEGTTTAGITSTTEFSPASRTTVKHSDTPQSAVANITDGYLSDVTITTGSGKDTTVVTPTGTDTSTGETRSNYLDATSRNASKTSQHSGGNEREHDLTVEENGYTEAQAELVLKYRETLGNIKREVADMFKDAFVLWLGGEAY